MEKKKKKILIIIIAIVTLASLYFGFMYFAYVYDYCPNTNENGAIPVGCLEIHPEKYENKSIVVKGKYAPFGDRDGCIHGISTPFAGHPYNLDFELMDGVNISTLVEWGEYYWIGTFHTWYFENGTYYLEYFEVSDIQPVQN